MHSIRTKFTFTVVSVIIITLCIATAIGVVSISKLGSDDADQVIRRKPLRNPLSSDRILSQGGAEKS